MLLSTLLGLIGPWQIVLVVVVILLLFGGRKIPELMRGLGQGMREFKDANRDDKSKEDRSESTSSTPSGASNDSK